MYFAFTHMSAEFARSLKVFESLGKWDRLFKALKGSENWVGSVKVCEFCGLQSARGKLSAYQTETAFPKTEQQFKPKKKLPCKVKKYTLPISSECRPSATVRVVPLYQMCGRVAYLCVAFLRHIAKVCEKFVNLERIFLYEPSLYYLHFHNVKPTFLSLLLGCCSG